MKVIRKIRETKQEINHLSRKAYHFLGFFFFGDRLGCLFFVLAVGEFVLFWFGGVPSCCLFKRADGSCISTRDSSSLDGSANSCCVLGAGVVVDFPVTKVGLVDFRVGMLTCSGGLRGLFN